jgi:hypothetical protein
MIESLVSTLIGPITGLISKFVPDKDKAAELAHDIATLADKQAHDQIMAQLAVNKVEAAHKSLFVSGWRPAVGWVCVAGMAFNFIVVPMLGPIFDAYSSVNLELLELEMMMPVLLGMLGLGSMRTAEKMKNVARNN